MFTLRSTPSAIFIAGVLVFSSCSSTSDEDSEDAERGAETTTRVESAETVEGSLVALSYNVAGLPELLSGSSPEEYMPQIAPLLNDYDLVLLQETWKTPDPNPLGSTRVYHEILEAGSTHSYKSESKPVPLGSDPSRPEALVSDGLNRFSNFEFGEVQRVAWTECFGGLDQSDGGSGDCLSQKGFSVAETTLADGVVVDVYNLHMEAGGSDEDRRISREDAEQLADFMAENSAGSAVIVGGDFNLHTDVDDPEEAFDVESFEIILNTGDLRDVCAELDCPEPERIDKFLFRSGGGIELDPTSWNFETDVFVTDDGEPLSDHDALAVTFEWRAA